jgi:hypothetical protein
MPIKNRDNAEYLATGIDNSGLREDAQETVDIVHGVVDKIVDEGNKAVDGLNKGGKVFVNQEKQHANQVVDEARKMQQAYDNLTGPEKAAKKVAEQIAFLKETIQSIETDIPKLQKAFDKAAPGKVKSDAVQELNAAKKELEEAKTELAQVENQNDKTSQATQRLTSQFRQMKDELTRMRQAGQQDSEEYSDLQKKAALLERQLKGTNLQMKVLSSPNAKFEGVISGVTGFTGALSAGMGIMGLFNSNNEELAKIQTKVQSVMAITIGLEQVANTLRSTSAFKLVTLTKIHDLFTAANYRLATAMGISTGAAQILMGTLTLGLSVVITGLIVLWNKYSDSQTKAAAYSAQSQKMMSDAMDDASKSLGSQMVKLHEMQNRWNSLGDNLKAKKKFIDENRNSFHDLGIEVDTINDVENTLVTNTGAVVKALQLRAEATAYAKVAEGYYEKKARGQMQADEIIHAGPQKEDVPIKYKKVTTQGTAGPVTIEQPYRDINDIKGTRENLRKRADKYRIGGEVNGVYGNNAINHVNDLNREANNLLKKHHVKRYYGSDTYSSDQSKAERERKAAAAKAAREKAKEKRERDQEAKQNASYENKKNEIDSKGSTETKRFIEDQQIKIREDKVAAMKDGSDKEIEQMKLNHYKETQELKREEEDYLKSKQDKAREIFISNPKNKKKTFDASTITLSEDEKNSYADRNSALLERQKSETIEYYRKILENYQTYAQSRLEITEKFEKQRKAFENADASKEQFAQLTKDEQDALNAVDQQFAKKQDSYKTMLATISDMSITQLKTALKLASQALSDYTESHSTSNTSDVFTTDYSNGMPTEKLDAKSKITPKDTNEIANLRATIEVLSQKLNEKQAKDVVDKTNGKAGKNVLKDWKNLSTILDSVDRKMEGLGNTIGGTTGEALKAAASISTSVISIISGITTLTDTSSISMTETANASQKAIKAVEKASIILAIVSAALELLQKIKSIFSNDASKEFELKFEQEKLQLAQDYNKALAEQLALEDKVFNTDKIRNAIKDVDAYYKALEGYEKLYNANNKSDATLKNMPKGGRYTRVYTTKLRNEMQIQTSQGNFWKHSKYENLEKWLKENGYDKLFDEDGNLNLSVAKSVAGMSSLTDQTKKYLNELISAKEEEDKMDEAIDDYINNEFGSLSDDLMNSLVDSIQNGTDAWTEFEKAGDDVIGNLGKEIAYTLFYADQFNAFKDKIKTILKSKVDGESAQDREKRIAAEEEKATEDFFGTLKDSAAAGANFMKQYQKDAKANGYDVYSDTDKKSGSTGKLEAALTEGTASEVLGVMNMSALDVRMLKDLEVSHFKDYGTEMNYIASMLDQTVQINANTYRTANNTDGLIKKLDEGFSGMSDRMDQVVKNTKGYTGRG